jgi:uncharacterized protein DUF397
VGRISDNAEVLFVNGADVPVEHKYAERMVVLRSADDPEGDALYYTMDEWAAFILGVKDGEFDGLAGEPTVSEPHEVGTDQGAAFPWTGRPGYPTDGKSGA